MDQKLFLLITLLSVLQFFESCNGTKDYYYTRTRTNPQHLRVSEKFKNVYVDEVEQETQINGTNYKYYKSRSTMSHDELIFEVLDKIFQHRLSAFYIYNYKNEDDKKRSSDPRLVSNEACARDLLYLVDNIPKRSMTREKDRDLSNHNGYDDQLTPELTAFFDSYGRQEAGMMLGNTYWVGAYDQCVNRHIFELNDAYDGVKRTSLDGRTPASGSSKDQQVVDFKGRYCVSSLKSPVWDSLIKQKKEQSRAYFKSDRQFNDYAKLFRLQVGICMPSSCDSTAIERHSEEIKLLTTSMLETRYADYELIDLYCLPDESSPLRQWSGSALNFILCLAFWLVLILLATFADVFEFVEALNASSKRQESSTKKWRRLSNFVTWFSLRANYRKLMKVNDEDAPASDKKPRQDSSTSEKGDSKKSIKKKDEKKIDKKHAEVDESKHLRVNIRFLNAFKVLIMCWIVNGHIMLLMIQTAKNILYSDALLNGLMHFLIGATFGVDLFFTMTGIITAYLIFNSGHAYRMKPAAWLYLSFHRYWRLAPMYLLMFWFSRSVMQLLGSGPLWDYGTSALTFRGLCNHESWWYPLTLTSNLHGLFEECMITSWYISCDMQFWLISPLFIHLLAKKPLFGWAASLATILVSSKVRFDSILSDQSARYDELVQPRADIFMRVSHDLPALYTHPHYRIASYMVGLLTGHYIYMIKSGKWRSVMAADCEKVGQTATNENVETNVQTDREIINEGKNKLKNNKNQPIRRRAIVAYLGLFLFFVMSFVSYILSHYYPSSMLPYARTIAGIFYSIDHLMMSVGASLVIVTMCFGQWSNLVKFLSHPNWTRLSKINYALLLLQCEAIYFQIFRYEQVPVAGTRELINILFNLLVTLYPLAFVVTLVFEFPLANIEKLLTGR